MIDCSLNLNNMPPREDDDNREISPFPILLSNLFSPLSHEKLSRDNESSPLHARIESIFISDKNKFIKSASERKGDFEF